MHTDRAQISGFSQQRMQNHKLDGFQSPVAEIGNYEITGWTIGIFQQIRQAG